MSMGNGGMSIVEYTLFGDDFSNMEQDAMMTRDSKNAGTPTVL